MTIATLCSTRRRVRSGFTLIELLTVIAIIGILAAILIPTVSSVRAKARATQCVSNLRQWGSAVRLFSNENKGVVPLLLNVSSDTNLRFYDPYFPKASIGSTAITPTDNFSSCPAVTRDESNANNRRNYSFVRPIGYKTAPSGSRFAGVSLSKSVDYYSIEAAKAPSRLFLMLEQKSGSDGPITLPDSISTNGIDEILGAKASGDKSLIRHGGIINCLYLDGHVSKLRIEDIDVNRAPPAQRAAFVQRYTL